MKPTRLPTPKPSRSGFTAIELLLVIAVIAILARLLFPAITGGIRAAKNARARTEARLIADAIKRYTVEYGTLPISSGVGGAETLCNESGSGDIINTLRGISTSVNKRGIVFLEAPGRANAFTSSGAYKDPWYDAAHPNNVYYIQLDNNLDRQVVYNGITNSTAVVISYGPNGIDDSNQKDDIANN